MLNVHPDKLSKVKKSKLTKKQQNTFDVLSPLVWLILTAAVKVFWSGGSNIG